MKVARTTVILCTLALGVVMGSLRVEAEPGELGLGARVIGEPALGAPIGVGGPPMGATIVGGPAIGGAISGAIMVGPPPFGGPGLDPEPALQFGLVLHGVGLTMEQEMRVRTIMESHRPALQKLFAQLRTTSEGMANRLLASGPVQASEFDADIKAVTGFREQLMREGLGVALELRQVLTPDQLAKASAVSKRLKELQGEMKDLLSDPGMPPVDAAMPPS